MVVVHYWNVRTSVGGKKIVHFLDFFLRVAIVEYENFVFANFFSGWSRIWVVIICTYCSAEILWIFSLFEAQWDDRSHE